MATINEIKQQAAAVKNATQVGENTAERVGGALAGLAEIAEQQDVELGKKFDKSSIVQDSGEAEDKVMSQKAVSDKLSDLSKSAFNYQFFLQAGVSFEFDPSSFSVTMHATAVVGTSTNNFGYYYENGAKSERYVTLESSDVTFTIKNFSYLYVDLEDNKVKVSESDLLSYDNRLVLLVNVRATSVNDFKHGMLVPYFKKNYIGDSIVQTTGEAEDKVMSQKAVSDKLSDLSKSAFNYQFFLQAGVSFEFDPSSFSVTMHATAVVGTSTNNFGYYYENGAKSERYVTLESSDVTFTIKNFSYLYVDLEDNKVKVSESDLLSYDNRLVLLVNVRATSVNDFKHGMLVPYFKKNYIGDSIVQTTGEAEDKVMSQKAVSDKLNELSKSAFNYDNIIRTIQRCGYSGDGAPFQTLQAYNDAIKHGFSILLADLMFTKDNVPVCSHDYYLNQYYGNVYNSDGNLVDKSLEIYIREKTYEELLAYDWGAGKYKGTKLLKFEDFVKFCKINGVSEMYVEIKELTSDIQASIACDIVKKYSMKEKTSFASTEGPLKRILNYLPYARVATMPSIINDNTINKLLSLNNGKCKLFFFAWDTTTLSDDIVKKLIDNNIDFEFGTLNTKEKVKEYFNKGNIYLYCTGVESDGLHIGNVLKELEI